MSQVYVPRVFLSKWRETNNSCEGFLRRAMYVAPFHATRFTELGAWQFTQFQNCAFRVYEDR